MATDYTKRARVGGSGLTVYSWKFGGENEVIQFARQVSQVSPSPVGAGVTPIHPMDKERPDHLITPQATSMGQITFELYELQALRAFQRLPGLKKCNDLVDVFAKVADEGNLTIEKWILKPGVHSASAKPESRQLRKEVYDGCVIANIMDGDQIEVGTMEVLKQVVVNYTGTKVGDVGTASTPS